MDGERVMHACDDGQLLTALTWLREQIELELADVGPDYKYSSFPQDDQNPILRPVQSDAELRHIYNFAGSYFLSLAHGDPMHTSEQDWPSATAQLRSYIELLKA